jgi:hypothetical protein
MNILLEHLPSFSERSWNPFSKTELLENLAKCSNTSSPGPDHIIWKYLKFLCSNDSCLSLFTILGNGCVQFGHWPTTFKESTTVIIPKPNKDNYSTPKSFHPIVLLNCLGKLFEKLLAKWLQFEAICYNFIHPFQMGGIIQRSTEDAGVLLTHFV